MSRDKQIEEMASDLENHTCMSSFQAEIASRTLYILGYRKASDVAREIFADIELKAPFFCENQIAYEHFYEELAELKKKYTQEK